MTEDTVGLIDLAEYLIKSLADHPEEVELHEREEDDTVLIELKISQEDLGKIIGKNGNTINAIRTVLQTAASSHKKRARLEVVGQAEIPVDKVDEEPDA
ncbi:MAG: KH domain-containing protein [Syntrophobacteraceae bacterium]